MSKCKTSFKVGGMGHSVKRKEDARFIRGKGNYVDDVVRPGMVFMDIVRSPYAHAKIKSINTEKALAHPGVAAVITGETLKEYNLHMMPTLMSDTQMVLPIDKVCYQSQEVAAVIGTDRYSVADGIELVEVEYEPLPVVVDPHKATDPDAPIIRDDKEGQTSNHIWHWEEGDKQATEEIFKNSDVVLKEKIYIPRIHVASIETCGCVSEFDKATGQLTVWMTTQAPHAIRTVLALVAGHVGLQEDKIRVISPDIGGGFGGKVPVYPGYVIAIAASVVTGLPVKWIEDRRENLQADSFARDYHMDCEIAADKDGTLKGLRIKTLADNGYADAAANPSKYPAGMFSICTGSYNFKNAFVEVDGVYTNKPPGGVAYRCSFILQVLQGCLFTCGCRSADAKRSPIGCVMSGNRWKALVYSKASMHFHILCNYVHRTHIDGIGMSLPCSGHRPVCIDRGLCVGESSPKPTDEPWELCSGFCCIAATTAPCVAATQSWMSKTTTPASIFVSVQSCAFVLVDASTSVAAAICYLACTWENSRLHTRAHPAFV